MSLEAWAAWGAAALVLLALGYVLWVLAVRHYYRLRVPRPQLLRARCKDGWELAVYARRAAVRRYEEPVLLCHGLAANRYTFDFEPPYSVAHALNEAGFDCFSVEWRGTGGSRPPPPGRRATDFTVDDHILQDGPALISLALQETGARQAFWLGHSLGGLVGYGVAQGPEGARLKGLLPLGAPVFFQYRPYLQALVGLGVRAAWPHRLRQEWTSAGLAPFLGYVALPLSDLVVNPRHIPPRIQRQVYANMMSSMSRRVLQQFHDWIRNDVFRSFDGKVDWRAGIAGLRVPLLVMGGAADRLAPPASLQAQYALAGSEDKTLHVFGRERGDKLDYGHGDLIFGEGAPLEVYPLLCAWLQARATPLKEPEQRPASDTAR
ncbi:MAG TPA: alpha/beta fold hydrolase [Aggregicoccus sp.]|nr:alpha/beta fold hydrolase [Aggregicoccus sp.]